MKQNAERALEAAGDDPELLGEILDAYDWLDRFGRVVESRRHGESEATFEGGARWTSI